MEDWQGEQGCGEGVPQRNDVPMSGSPPPKIESTAARAGLVLAGSAVLGLVLMNSPLARDWESVLQAAWGVHLGPLHLVESNLLWINDALMALFFLQVGIEIKREWLFGALANARSRALPVAAALGGMAVPAMVFVAINAGHAKALAGWAVPAATDIAFALGFMALLARGLPPQARIFLTAVAVLDDLGAVLIIAAFYTARISGPMLGASVAIVLLMVLLQGFGVRRAWPYLFLGVVLWGFVLKSGVHATVAGVLAGILLPQTREGGAGVNVEHALAPFVSWLILPLFALANAGVQLGGAGLALLGHGVTWGVALGLVLGKPVGILAGVGATVMVVGGLPPGYSWRLMLPIAAFCGVGFTMSLFIAGLAFGGDVQEFDAAKIGVLLGTVLALTAGTLITRRLYPNARAA
ncbi:Na+/H+ antiporter NhaA [Thiomonas sp. FB-Cd]|uniref:Na+/H+ antiporter NhaA n=1 Tax=Thiomonas sp. FB-Cd TaxID=1158292 RepID=UPI00068ACF69|nr:Na+/H+ antiporter NhaA [Thiomonas sp. FB-Cd]